MSQLSDPGIRESGLTLQKGSVSWVQAEGPNRFSKECIVYLVDMT